MIDHFAIFLNSGVGLWSWNSEERLKGRPVANLVRTVLMEGKSSESQWDNDVYSLQWTFANELDLVFVVRCAFLSYISPTKGHFHAEFSLESPCFFFFLGCLSKNDYAFICKRFVGKC